MIDPQCPGRIANANLESTLLVCDRCGCVVEIFGDEHKVHCRCGNWVFREASPSCALWCSAAERCFGTIGRPTRPGKATPAAGPEAARADASDGMTSPATDSPSKSKHEPESREPSQGKE